MIFPRELMIMILEFRTQIMWRDRILLLEDRLNFEYVHIKNNRLTALVTRQELYYVLQLKKAFYISCHLFDIYNSCVMGLSHEHLERVLRLIE